MESKPPYLLSSIALQTDPAPSHVSKSHNHQVYLDVEPANTEHLLKVIRALDISTYRLSYERTNRLRIGAIGPQIAELVPDAVELVPKRVLPPLEKGGEPIVLHNVPVVNDNVLFMYGVGATQELIRNVESLKDDLSQQVDRVMELVGETVKLEHIVSKSSDGEEEMRIRSSIAQAGKVKTELDIEIRRAEDEKEHLRLQEERELAQIQRNEELTMVRLTKEEEMAKHRAEEEMRIRFEVNRKIEKARSEAIEQTSLIEFEREILLQNASEEMKARTGKAIAEAKAEAERANEDVKLRALRAEAEQSRKRNIAAINAIANHVAHSLYSASKNPKQVLIFIWYAAVLATGIYSAKEIARLCRLIIESTLGKPKLIRETTKKKMPHQLFCDVVGFIKNIFQKKTIVSIEDAFEDVALRSELKKRILFLTSAASKVRNNNAPHRHILFYGQPGTGKTMVAKKMAKSIGMEYALMSGGDVGPLGSDAVTQIHNLFRWAKFSKRGVMLFIDEAEAFLGDRSKNAMSEDAHNALNALLYNTGSECRHFMMVLATNRAEDLDAAILDRCDESIFFPLPDAASRRKLVIDYFELFVRSMETKQNEEPSLFYRICTFLMTLHSSTSNTFRVQIDQDVMNDLQISSIVEATAGFSAREIAKLFIAIQGSIYASFDGRLTSQIIYDTVSLKVDEHKVKVAMSMPNDHDPMIAKGSKVFNPFVDISSIGSSDLSSDLEYGDEADAVTENHENTASKSTKITNQIMIPLPNLVRKKGAYLSEISKSDKENVSPIDRNPLLSR